MSSVFALHHVSLYVRDVDASAAFYANVLGLQEIPNRVGRSHIRWFTIDGFRTFHLIGGDPEQERPHQFSTHVALATRDFESALARLDQHGIEYVSLTRHPKSITVRADGVRQVYFQDPEIRAGPGTTAQVLGCFVSSRMEGMPSHTVGRC